VNLDDIALVNRESIVRAGIAKRQLRLGFSQGVSLADSAIAGGNGDGSVSILDLVSRPENRLDDLLRI
jgi:hypothetical protein